MIGNAVPVNLAKHIAISIKSQIENAEKKPKAIKKPKKKTQAQIFELPSNNKNRKYK